MRSTTRTAVALSACVLLLAACGTPVQDARPTVRIAEAVQPSPARALDRILPTSEELSVLGPNGMMGQRVQGGPSMLLASVGEADAAPADCVSATYRLQRVVYNAGPVQSVASQSWVGGSFDAPPVSGFFGVVQFSSEADAQAFFADAAEKWHRCNGQALVLNQPDHGAQRTSRITDVTVDGHMVSAMVMQDSGSMSQRALGVAADCVVDVEVSDINGLGGPQGASTVARLMLEKVGAA
ncbi:sensor domain-containing protein [Mycobacterium sp. NPDC051804]|uniref:sensor domain-containing protein n=1 Tax=Mycobacterium sp. NPDC051804 TaxID=3364295 RepID=UPI0037A6C3F8